MALARTKSQSIEHGRSQNLPADLRFSASPAIEPLGSPHGGALEPDRDPSAGRSRYLTGLLIGRLILVAGLGLIGSWILLGSLLGWEMPWNTKTTLYTPMSPAAEQYWRNLDVAQVQRDMAGWKPEDLAKVFISVQAQSFDPETRNHLTTLGKTLRLPGFVPSSSLLPTLLRQPGFLIGMMLTIAMWLAAAAIGLLPMVRRPAPVTPVDDLRLQNLPIDQANLEELLPDDLSLETPALGLDENKAEENKAEEETPAAQEEDQASSGLGDLSSLFEEEDTSISALETFCRNLAEVGIDNLLAKANETVRNLRDYTAQTASEKRA